LDPTKGYQGLPKKATACSPAPLSIPASFCSTVTLADSLCQDWPCPLHGQRLCPLLPICNCNIASILPSFAPPTSIDPTTRSCCPRHLLFLFQACRQQTPCYTAVSGKGPRYYRIARKPELAPDQLHQSCARDLTDCSIATEPLFILTHFLAPSCLADTFIHWPHRYLHSPEGCHCYS